MRYYIIAGEASGDLHASNLIKKIHEQDSDAVIRCWGGELMQLAGAELVKHYKDTAFMGIVPVVLNCRTIFKNLAFCKKDLLNFAPDVAIFVDYPGFNLKIAQFAHSHNIKTIYYISPKIWAWKTKRVYKIKSDIDLMLTIFPFETNFYRKYDYPVTYVGNPLFDSIQKQRANINVHDDFRKKNQLDERPIISILAGSRKHEIMALLPTMLDAADSFTEYNIVIAAAPNIERSIYDNIIGLHQVVLVEGQTYELLQNSVASIVASGTATLETALFGIPQVVCYKMGFGRILEMFRSFILKVPFFSLVNLVAEKEIVKELFQSQVTPSEIKKELLSIIDNGEYRQAMIDGYNEIRQKLATPNSPSEMAAKNVVNFARQSKHQPKRD